MLPKKNRLSRTEFSKHFKNGKRFHSKIGTIVHVPSSDFHASVVVSKKVHKRAVVRNKLRRRSYGVIYNKLKKSNSTGVFILLLKPSILSLTQKQQLIEIRSLIGLVTKTTYNNSHV